jgi:hypothetical protein
LLGNGENMNAKIVNYNEWIPYSAITQQPIKTIEVTHKDRILAFGIYFRGLEPHWLIRNKGGNCDSHSHHALLYPYRRTKHVLSVWTRRRHMELKKIPYTMCDMCGEDISTCDSLDPNQTGIVMRMCPSCNAFCGWPVMKGDTAHVTEGGCYYCGGARGLLAHVTKPYECKVHKQCVSYRARRQEKVAMDMAEELKIGKYCHYDEKFQENPFWYEEHLHERDAAREAHTDA